jgi:hypothetical protein
MRRQGVWVRGAVWFLALLSFPILFADCAEEPNPVGFDRSGRQITSAAIETLLVAVRDSSIRATPTTGTSRSILVGSDDRAISNGLVRFDVLPDTVGLIRAYIRVHLRTGRGDPLELGMRKVLGAKSSWLASEVKWETAPEVDPDPISTVRGVPTSTIEADSTDSVAFQIPLDLLRYWKAVPDSNAGVQIAADRGAGTARIVSHNDPIFGRTYRIATPSLRLIYRESDRNETVVLATADAYVYQDRRPEPSPADSTAWVTSGPPSRLFLDFDLAGLLPHASIVRATLLLPVRKFDLDEGSPMLLGAYMVLDTTYTLAPIAAGLSRDPADPFRIEIGNLVQRWADGARNDGVMVRAVDEVSTIEGIEFYTSKASADTLRPGLRILYVPPPEPRWPGKQ